MTSTFWRTASFCVFWLACLACSSPLRASSFYVDSAQGNDANAGTSRGRPWKTLEKINATDFHPGDRILLKAGSKWVGQLVLHNSGSAGHPIKIDRYGDGARPRIDGEGNVENVVQLQNVQQVELRNLELTNHGDTEGVRRGVLIAAVDYGTAHHIVIGDLYIHDVNGTNKKKETGGILFRTMGSTKPSRFDDLLIERNIIWKVDRSAIGAQSNEFARSKWYPSHGVVIRDNYAEDIGGDGIVPWATDGALIEHNIVLHCNHRAGSYNAGIWQWSTDNSLFQLNEAAFTHTTLDGEGFDSDYNSRNTHFIYNYSHDNEGGFMLICTPVKRDEKENWGNTGTLIDYNISRNDHTRAINLQGADQTTVEHNAVYESAGDNVNIVQVTNWEGWSKDAVFRNNTFAAAGVGSYGHESKRIADGTYEITPGWGEASGIRFEGNTYLGNQMNLPVDPQGKVDATVPKPVTEPEEPQFDPAAPDNFSAYIAKHRAWMLRLFEKQFGTRPHLLQPHTLSSVVADAGV